MKFFSGIFVRAVSFFPKEIFPDFSRFSRHKTFFPEPRVPSTRKTVVDDLEMPSFSKNWAPCFYRSHQIILLDPLFHKITLHCSKFLKSFCFSALTVTKFEVFKSLFSFEGRFWTDAKLTLP